MAKRILSAIWELRQSGKTLQQIGDLYGVTREMIRIDLQKHYGTTKLEHFIATKKVASILKCTTGALYSLIKKGLVTPFRIGKGARGGKGRFCWSIKDINSAGLILYNRTCRSCGSRITLHGRWVFCNDKCANESRSYKNRSPEGRARHLISVRRWQKEHPEQNREIQRRAQAKYEAKLREQERVSQMLVEITEKQINDVPPTMFGVSAELPEFVREEDDFRAIE